MDVTDDTGVYRGRITDILQTGANGVYVISAPGRKDIMIPAVEEFVLAKDVMNKRITVRILREI